jgi:hypothetical protein
MESDATRGRELGGGAVGLGCMACGSKDLEATRPGWVEGAGDWLRFGGRWRPSGQRCRRCGQVDSAGSGRYLVHRTGWWQVPVQLVGALRRRRRMVPAPATYLLAAAVGAVLGGCAQLVFGWTWWLVAAGVLVAVWLFFALSAFRGGGGAGRSLATEVLMATDPVRAIQRERRELVERFRAAPFPLYGLPVSWPGPRHLGGWGSRRAAGERPVVTSLTLAHGDPQAADGPQLLVEVRVDPEAVGQPPGGDPELRRRLAADLHQVAGIAAAEPPGGGEKVGDPGPGWSRVMIPVAGRQVAFDLLAAGRHWVAVAELEEGPTLVLNARDLAVDGIELVEADVEPYVEGARRLEETRARGNDA